MLEGRWLEQFKCKFYTSEQETSILEVIPIVIQSWVNAIAVIDSGDIVCLSAVAH